MHLQLIEAKSLVQICEYLVNENLEDEPGLLNKDAYENWIIKVELSDTAELKNLMDAKAYEEFCAE